MFYELVFLVEIVLLCFCLGQILVFVRYDYSLMGVIKFYRAISKAQLRMLPPFHMPPIDVVVFHGSQGISCFEVGFPLRCLQRLSIPNIATLQCGWRHNRSTRGSSIPVLSY